MSDFPNNFDYVVYGTGITESILSSALSVIGRSVLHIDKNSYYGVYNGCLRLNELENILNEWKESSSDSINDDNNPFYNNSPQVSFIDFSWHIKNDENGEITNGSEVTNSTIGGLTETIFRQRMRGFEFELIPKLVYCESLIVDALIQSDVTRYLEFKFVSKFASISNGEIISIPINRSDIVKTRVFSLRQKRQLTSFLEWCFTVSLDDELLTKYANQPLYNLMRNEKNIDSFTENIIIQCLAFSSADVETVEGTMQIKRFLKSFNKFGPYPIMWPNYGSGEIPQAFCRMSAVFGGIYCLNTSIQSCSYQDTANGCINDTETAVPIEHRKLKLTLSNESAVYTDKIICNKSFINPSFLLNPQSTTWVCRTILVSDRSLLGANREANDILLLPLHLEQVTRPIVLLELPIEKHGDSGLDLFVTHLVAYSSVCLNAKDLFAEIIGKLFVYGDTVVNDTANDSHTPHILFSSHFTLPDYTDVSIDSTGPHASDIVASSVAVNSSLESYEFDVCLREARDVFTRLCPAEPFLPRPPNPEDIILLGDDIVPLANSTTAGDFPFASGISDQPPLADDAPLAPGDDTQTITVASLMAEIDMDATPSERNEI